MEKDEGSIQWKAIFENKSRNELAQHRIEEIIPRRIMAEGTTMSRLSSSYLGRLRLLVTMCCIVSVPGINCQPGKESWSVVLPNHRIQFHFQCSFIFPRLCNFTDEFSIKGYPAANFFFLTMLRQVNPNPNPNP